MAFYEFPGSGSSDDESDGDDLRSESGVEPRLTKLGSNIPIPSQSDMPESEGPDEQLCNHAIEVQSEVDLLNSMIMSDDSRLHMPKAILSSASGKLKRPSLGYTHREPSPAPRGDIYDIPTLPETVVHTSSSLLQRNPSQRSQKSSLPSRPQRKTKTVSRRGILDTDPLSDRVIESHSTIGRVHSIRGSQEPSKKRHRLDDSTSGRPVTRSLKRPLTAGFDLSQTISKQRPRHDRASSMSQVQVFVPEDDPSPSLDRQQSYPSSPAQGHLGSRQVVEVVIDNPTSIQLPSDSTNTRKQPTAPPAVAQIPNSATNSPLPPLTVLQDRHRDRVSSERPADSVTSAVVDLGDAQPPVTEEAQRSTSEDNPLSEPCTQPTTDARSQTAALAADTVMVHRLHEKYRGDDSSDDFAGPENCDDETNSCEDVFVPEELKKALENSHLIHKQAELFRQRFDGIRILKSYNSLKKNVLQWKAAENYSETDQLIQLSQKITKEAETIFQKSVWDQQIGLGYIYKRVLPTLVRMLNITLVYYLSEVGTVKRLPYEPLQASRSIVRAILHVSNQARVAKTPYSRPRHAISMVARIEEVKKVFDKRLTALELAKSTAESFQNQQTQRLRQEAIDRENEDDLKLKEWRQRWNVLHDQRLGAAMEGRAFLSHEQGRHLRQIPLANPYVARPHWDETQSFYLVEGLQNFKGPNVYREIFRKYCRRGGPLQEFNVAEIVDKAVSLKGVIIKLAEDDGEVLDQWVQDIFDPRMPPEGLRGGEFLSQP